MTLKDPLKIKGFKMHSFVVFLFFFLWLNVEVSIRESKMSILRESDSIARLW